MKTMRILLVLGLVAACGSDPPPPPKRGTSPKSDKSNPATDNAGRPGAKKDKPVMLQPYPKVPDDFRRELTKADFTPDPTGDMNRDPFRSYLIDLSTGPAKKKGVNPDNTGIDDDCNQTGVVAENYGLRDLKLVGIVLRGTKTYALFTDSQNLGHTANRGDCISKERARIKDIGSDQVTIEIRGEAPPGAPAPPPREEVWKLYQEELELQNGDSDTGPNNR